MHASIAAELRCWAKELGLDSANVKIADVGSYNLNGAVKDILPSAVGFDILPGPGVDVVIAPGEIPDEDQGRYDVVVSISALLFAPDPRTLCGEILDLLRPGGRAFVSTCAPSCTLEHTGPEGFPDRWRLAPEEIMAFFAPVAGEWRYSGPDDHRDIVITLEKPCG